MDILEVNRNTLANLYEQFPDSFKGLNINGKFLVYNGEAVDISEFNINDLLGNETSFASSISGFTAADIFKIIKLHVNYLKSQKMREAKQRPTMDEPVADNMGGPISEMTETPKEKVTPSLITEEEFYQLLNSTSELRPEERAGVNMFYDHLGDSVFYEENLLSGLRGLVNRFRNYTYEMEFSQQDAISSKQQEAVQKSHEFEERKAQTQLTNTNSPVKEQGQSLQLKYNPNKAAGGNDNNGSISTLLIIGTIIVVAIILTIITLSII